MSYELTELDREARMGGAGTETTVREIRRIDVSDFASRRDEIADELWSAAVDIGFFQVVGHGIDLADIREAFRHAERFFALPVEAKARHARMPGTNTGWERRRTRRSRTRSPALTWQAPRSSRARAPSPATSATC
jgi:isopenicillin N synthase-like dioxygenase